MNFDCHNREPANRSRPRPTDGSPFEVTALFDIDRYVMIGTNNTITACSLVRAGAGVALVEPMSVRELFPGLLERPFRPRIVIHPRILYSRQTPLSRMGQAFLDILTNVI